MAEKTEKPTAKRRKDSAKKGQSFKSKDLITTIILLTGCTFIYYCSDYSEFMGLCKKALLHSELLEPEGFLINIFLVFFRMSFPFIALCAFFEFISTMIQTKFAVSTEALKVNFESLNPVEGFKKLFHLRTLKEFLKSLCYLVVFVAACWYVVMTYMRDIIAVWHHSLPGLIHVWMFLVWKSVLIFIAFSSLVLVGDFLTEYYLHNKDMSMDKHEVKQERHEMEGKPEIKNTRKTLHMDLLNDGEKDAIKQSKVVMANPTHIAVGIYFNPAVAMLPFISLRCAGVKARAAIAFAEKEGIPVVRNISLTRRLYRKCRRYTFISLGSLC